MTELKSFALSLCIAVFLFSIIKSVLPSERYEKYFKMIISLVFIVLLFGGIRSFSKQSDFMNGISYENVSRDITDALKIQVMDHLNQKLTNLGYQNASCVAVDLSENDGNYSITGVYFEAKDTDTKKLKQDVSDITGIKEGNIYVN